MLYPDIYSQKKPQQNSTRYRTALYLRLSREDGDKTESDSIANQRTCWKPILQTTRNCASWMMFVTMVTPARTLNGLRSKTCSGNWNKGLSTAFWMKDLSRFGPELH